VVSLFLEHSCYSFLRLIFVKPYNHVFHIKPLATRENARGNLIEELPRVFRATAVEKNGSFFWYK
jgi:hypothetical protein